MYHLENIVNPSLLLLRVMAGAIYIDSGYNDLKDPAERARGLALPKGLTIFIGFAEIAGGVGIIAGILQQLAALGLIAIMLGAIQKKIFVWRTGFWGKDGLGWNYDLALVSMLAVIVATNGGEWVITR